jgi:hypothetical protein
MVGGAQDGKELGKSFPGESGKKVLDVDRECWSRVVKDEIFVL